MHSLSYLMPGKVNEVVALLEEVEMGWVAKTRGSLEMKRPALSVYKWQFLVNYIDNKEERLSSS